MSRSLGLDVRAARSLLNTSSYWLLEGKPGILTTHYLDDAERLCPSAASCIKGFLVREERSRSCAATGCQNLIDMFPALSNVAHPWQISTDTQYRAAATMSGDAIDTRNDIGLRNPPLGRALCFVWHAHGTA